MKFWVLIGEGPNNVTIPALVFSTKEIALEKCKAIFGEDPKALSDNRYCWICDGDEFESSVVEQVYCHYYGGCGEFYRAILQEVEEGVPFTSFDLD